MTALEFTVNGIPAPQGSKRHVGNGIMIESSKGVKPWRQDVRLAAMAAAQKTKWKPRNLPVSITINFYMPRPKGHYGTGRNAGVLKPSAPLYPAVRPDKDKLERSTLDALTSAGVIVDDSRVVHSTTWKTYADGRPPGAHIQIKHLENQ